MIDYDRLALDVRGHLPTSVPPSAGEAVTNRLHELTVEYTSRGHDLRVTDVTDEPDYPGEFLLALTCDRCDGREIVSFDSSTGAERSSVTEGGMYETSCP